MEINDLYEYNFTASGSRSATLYLAIGNSQALDAGDESDAVYAAVSGLTEVAEAVIAFNSGIPAGTVTLGTVVHRHVVDDAVSAP